MSGPKIIGIAGFRKVGKTTLVERLVGELGARGYRVSTVKHAHHDAEIDEPGRDSWRHREAGAQEVALVTARRFAIMHELRGAPEPPLADIVARMAPADVVIVEGFKEAAIPKIEVRRTGLDHPPLAGRVANVIAIATNDAVAETHLPVISLDDVPAIADFIVDRLALEGSHARALG